VWFTARNAPDWKPNREPAMPALREAAKIKETWRQAALYAVSGGGYIAFAVYMAIMLKDIYAYDVTSANLRVAGLALAAVVARPIGGWLSDRFGAKNVMLVAYAAVGVLALIISATPQGELLAGSVYSALGFAFGVAMGGNFAMLAKRVDPKNLGAAGGLVACIGGLGGFFPPLVLGVLKDMTGTYAVGLMLLSAVAFACVAYVAVAYRGTGGRARAVVGQTA
jgi:MFS transporter, NNP family, nitrate/nitrite transporter